MAIAALTVLIYFSPMSKDVNNFFFDGYKAISDE